MSRRLVTAGLTWRRVIVVGLKDKLLNRANRKAAPAIVAVLRIDSRRREVQVVGARGGVVRRGPVATARATVVEGRTMFLIIKPGISGSRKPQSSSDSAPTLRSAHLRPEGRPRSAKLMLPCFSISWISTRSNLTAMKFFFSVLIVLKINQPVALLSRCVGDSSMLSVDLCFIHVQQPTLCFLSLDLQVSDRCLTFAAGFAC